MKFQMSFESDSKFIQSVPSDWKWDQILQMAEILSLVIDYVSYISHQLIENIRSASALEWKIRQLLISILN